MQSGLFARATDIHMMRLSIRRLLASSAILVAFSVAAGPAAAYLPEGRDFAARAGSAASLTMADIANDPAAQALRSLLDTSNRDLAFLEKRDQAGIAEFYQERNYLPVWTENGFLTPRAKAVMARIARADEDGLDPAAFTLPAPGLGERVAAAPSLVARLELTLSRAVLAYARQADGGRLDPRTLSRLMTPKAHYPDPIEVLTRVSSEPDGAAALASYNPQHPAFLKLRQELAAERAANAGIERPKPIPPGKAMKLGVRDPRVPLLRARLGIADPADPAELDLYDDTLAEAVVAFQTEHGLAADGVVGAGTLGILNGATVDRVPLILANMERWRWLPRDLGRFHVFVNIPAFKLDVVKDGKVVHETRVVVGSPKNQSPIFSDEIEHIVVNPYWNVPASIAVKEMLPQIQADPYYLTRRNYEVLVNVNGRMRSVDPGMIDWTSAAARSVRIRQIPGDDNALGDVKFLFPNEHSVYLHDTPSKSYFQRDMRALSHGCIRVMNPFDFADVLVSEEPKISGERIRAMVGGREAWLNLAKHVPVHLTYFTAWVDDSGKLQTRPDIYGHDAKMIKAMGLESSG